MINLKTSVLELVDNAKKEINNIKANDALKLHDDKTNLFIDIKSAPKKTPVTPLIDKRFLTKSLSISSFLVISKDPSFETFLPGKNFSAFGFGVISV